MFDNGKSKLSKKKVLVQVETTEHQSFIGEIFIAHDERVSDLLNDNRRFIPVELQSQGLHMFNKDSIVDIKIITTAPLENNNPYKILRVQKGASFDEIRNAWVKRLKTCHPDRLTSLDVDEDIVYEARRVAQKLNYAYDAIVKEMRDDPNGKPLLG